MVGVLTRLALLTGDDAYRQRADALIAAFAGEVTRNFFPLSTLLNNAALAQRPVQIVLVGSPGDPALAALREAVGRVSLPNQVLSVLAPDAALPAGHPAIGKGLVGGKAAAYVCEGPVCSLAIETSQALVEHLEAIH
jgi:hypothetical protein